MCTTNEHCTALHLQHLYNAVHAAAGNSPPVLLRRRRRPRTKPSPGGARSWKSALISTEENARYPGTTTFKRLVASKVSIRGNSQHAVALNIQALAKPGSQACHKTAGTERAMGASSAPTRQMVKFGAAKILEGHSRHFFERRCSSDADLRVQGRYTG